MADQSTLPDAEELQQDVRLDADEAADVSVSGQVEKRKKKKKVEGASDDSMAADSASPQKTRRKSKSKDSVESTGAVEAVCVFGQTHQLLSDAPLGEKKKKKRATKHADGDDQPDAVKTKKKKSSSKRSVAQSETEGSQQDSNLDTSMESSVSDQASSSHIVEASSSDSLLHHGTEDEANDTDSGSEDEDAEPSASNDAPEEESATVDEVASTPAQNLDHSASPQAVEAVANVVVSPDTNGFGIATDATAEERLAQLLAGSRLDPAHTFELAPLATEAYVSPLVLEPLELLHSSSESSSSDDDDCDKDGDEDEEYYDADQTADGQEGGADATSSNAAARAMKRPSPLGPLMQSLQSSLESPAVLTPDTEFTQQLNDGCDEVEITPTSELGTHTELPELPPDYLPTMDIIAYAPDDDDDDDEDEAAPVCPDDAAAEGGDAQPAGIVDPALVPRRAIDKSGGKMKQTSYGGSVKNMRSWAKGARAELEAEEAARPSSPRFTQLVEDAGTFSRKLSQRFLNQFSKLRRGSESGSSSSLAPSSQSTDQSYITFAPTPPRKTGPSSFFQPSSVALEVGSSTGRSMSSNTNLALLGSPSFQGSSIAMHAGEETDPALVRAFSLPDLPSNTSTPETAVAPLRRLPGTPILKKSTSHPDPRDSTGTVRPLRMPGDKRVILVKFHESVTVRRTWAKRDYDRKGEVTWRLTTDQAMSIRNELNEFKATMDIHIDSRQNTHYY